MTDAVARAFLSLTHFAVILVIFCIIFYCRGRSFLLQTVLLIAVDMVINVALKGYFKVPPVYAQSSSFAFPSGHMQLAVVLYTWLWLQWQTKLGLLALIVILTGIGFALVHFHYHSIADVLGGLGVGLLLCIGYKQLLHKKPTWLPSLLLSIALMGFVYNVNIYQKIPKHANGATVVLLLGGFLGVCRPKYLLSPIR